MFIFYATYKTWLYLYSTTVCWQRITQFIYTFLDRWTENNAMFLFFYNLCWTVINTSYFLFSSGQASFAAVLLNMDLSAKYVIFILWLSVYHFSSRRINVSFQFILSKFILSSKFQFKFQTSSARRQNWRRVLCTWKLLSEYTYYI